MAEVVENTENTENETPAVPQMSTVERAEMLLKQDATIREKIKSGATLDEAVDPSNKEFGPLAHPEQVQMRVAKRAMMLEAGIAPYPVHLDVTDTIEAVRAKYDGKLEAGEETEDMVGIAGRVLFLRNAGGLCFVQLSAGDGTKIQGMISKKEIGADSLKQFKQLVDLGDHLYLKGRVIASKTGELSVFATEWAIASKALQPLPALHKDLNEDTRTRKPYIGMIADEKIRNMVRNRSKAVASLRRTFDDHDFLEVETPMLQTLHGGAAARPFTTHMNAFDLDLYLRIAPELFLKRCLVGGIDRVFEINRDFRNEGVDATHAPEFTMVEAYQAYGTYDSIGQLDILYMTRVQKERFFNEEDYIRLKNSYVLTKEKMGLAKPDMAVLHPLPRVNEIALDVDDDPRAAYFEQVQNGVYVRMALIMTLLGLADPKAPKEEN